ncbi:MAG: hypothetical protein B7Z66_14725 [Chromatiales bacterium 21-64-14]|nr:MAG: hypothetical protein B7Z66_14725 [Chromatiales bacterium 21-64-14]HQU17145.1 universal stress protein [Gammaproteobacteria bacterium]
MEAYRNILIALDFAPGADAVLERARDLSERHGARLVLLHVVEYVPPLDLAYDPVVPMGVDIENQLVERAQAELEGRVARQGLAGAEVHVEVGSPKREIVHFAEQCGADLIVVGTHGRHGLSLLLGSTANGVLHHAPCDVLAVRITEPSSGAREPG